MTGTDYYSTARTDLTAFVPAGCRRVLETGCGSGATGSALRAKLGDTAELIGIECVQKMADKARTHFNRVFCENVETFQLPFEQESFDCLIYGDVLEHLIDPWNVLKRHVGLLKTGGMVVASIPNIAHYRTVKMLKKGEWRYTDAGLMDRTHLRFFTLTTIKELFISGGLTVTRVEPKISGSNNKKFLARLWPAKFLDGVTEQYIVVGKKT